MGSVLLIKTARVWATFARAWWIKNVRFWQGFPILMANTLGPGDARSSGFQLPENARM
jgi:hypothetical protein